MTIEAVSGHKKYRQDPLRPCMVQVQRKHGGRWTDFAPRDTPKEAAKLVLTLAHSGESDPQARHTGNDANDADATREEKKR